MNVRSIDQVVEVIGTCLVARKRRGCFLDKHRHYNIVDCRKA